MLLLLYLLTSLVVGISCQYSYYCGSTYNYYGVNGTIYSPNYPSYYRDNTNCNFTWFLPTLSSVSLTVEYIDMENCGRQCSCDWVEVTCSSHSVTIPTRYCGRGRELNPVTFTPCRQVVIRFKTDSSVIGSGFAIRYQADPIECDDNCTLMENRFWYSCSCDRNLTNVTMITMPANPHCVVGCSRQSVSFSSFCNCAVTRSVTTTTRYCSPPCRLSYDFYGYPTCRCSEITTAPSLCPSGCYRTTDWYGYPYCNCPQTTQSPYPCPYGCYSDFDYWGYPYCNCPASTQPPIWCSSDCVSDIDVYGSRYCRCSTTTLPPCFSPCYYTWDYSYDYSGRRICYCPTTTTTPPSTGCNKTLTASFGTVTSPYYPNSYPRGIDCYQYIAVPKATSINIRVLDIYVYYSSSYNCEYDYVEITGCDGSFTQFCASNTIPTNGLVFKCTDHSLVTIRFHSSYYYYSYYRGFKLSYSSGFASNCSDSGYYLSQGNTGLITSPNYPNNFPFHSECFNYLFTDEDDIKIGITFDQLRLEDSARCTNVVIKMTCQDDNEQSQTVCGTQIPAPVTFDCRTLQIWFKSSATTSFNPRYFKLRYYAVAKSPTWPTLAADPRSGENDLPQSGKIGIGLGVGVGGFFLIILIVIIIVLVVISQRQAARREQHHLEDLAVILRNMNDGRGSEPSVSIQNWRGAPGVGRTGLVAEGFTNRMAEVAEEPLVYITDREIEPEAQSNGGFVAEEPDVLLLIP